MLTCCLCDARRQWHRQSTQTHFKLNTVHVVHQLNDKITISHASNKHQQHYNKQRSVVGTNFIADAPQPSSSSRQLRRSITLSEFAHRSSECNSEYRSPAATAEGSSSSIVVHFCRSEEPLHNTNMDISTGHMILVLISSNTFLSNHLRLCLFYCTLFLVFFLVVFGGSLG